MTYLIDTNVISELNKGPRCHPRVASWFDTVTNKDLHLSVLVLGEIRKGIEQVRPRDRMRAEALERWLADIVQAFGNRILPIDRKTADAWGHLMSQRSIPFTDGLLAAQANVFGLTFVTRNTRDVEGLAERILNPFEA